MGIFTRPESRYWQLYLETTKQKEPTDIRIGTTVTQQRESRRLAEDRYHQRMNELAARLYKLPSAQPAIRFAKYATAYATDTIAHRAGARREQEIVKHLIAFFGDDLLTAIDRERVTQYHTHRKTSTPPAGANTINREVDLLKGMLRDAVPKYLPQSPLAGMPRLRTIPPRRRLLSTDEEARLLANGDVQDRAILVLGLETMMRLGDLLDLERRDHTGVWLYVADPKGGASYRVGLSPRAQGVLDELERANPDGRHYFPKFRRALNPRDWPGSVRQRLEYLCRQATPPVPYGRTAGGVTFHWATRRTGATRELIEKRVPLPIVQQQGNWKKPTVLLEIYSQVRDEDVLHAVGAVAPQKARRRR